MATYCRAWWARKAVEAVEAATAEAALATPTTAPVGMELEPSAAPT
jgi:hypothetical protein